MVWKLNTVVTSKTTLFTLSLMYHSMLVVFRLPVVFRLFTVRGVSWLLVQSRSMPSHRGTCLQDHTLFNSTVSNVMFQYHVIQCYVTQFLWIMFSLMWAQLPCLNHTESLLPGRALYMLSEGHLNGGWKGWRTGDRGKVISCHICPSQLYPVPLFLCSPLRSVAWGRQFRDSSHVHSNVVKGCTFHCLWIEHNNTARVIDLCQSSTQPVSGSH